MCLYRRKFSVPILGQTIQQEQPTQPTNYFWTIDVSHVFMIKVPMPVRIKVRLRVTVPHFLLAVHPLCLVSCFLPLDKNPKGNLVHLYPVYGKR